MRYNVIAIEREYASGGSEIGEKLSAKLGIPCYGREVLERAAEKMGLPSGELSALEESVTGSFLYNMYLFANIYSGDGTGLTMAQKLSIAESDVIRDLALNPCIIIGRSAAGVLQKMDNVLRIFVHADYDSRIKRATEVYHNDPLLAESELRRYDKRRANYFKANVGMEWKDLNSYHMFLNSGKLGIDPVVDIICSAAK